MKERETETEEDGKDSDQFEWSLTHFTGFFVFIPLKATEHLHVHRRLLLFCKALNQLLMSIYVSRAAICSLKTGQRSSTRCTGALKPTVLFFFPPNLSLAGYVSDRSLPLSLNMEVTFAASLHLSPSLAPLHSSWGKSSNAMSSERKRHRQASKQQQDFD